MTHDVLRLVIRAAACSGKRIAMKRSHDIAVNVNTHAVRHVTAYEIHQVVVASYIS